MKNSKRATTNIKLSFFILHFNKAAFLSQIAFVLSESSEIDFPFSSGKKMGKSKEEISHTLAKHFDVFQLFEIEDPPYQMEIPFCPFRKKAPECNLKNSKRATTTRRNENACHHKIDLFYASF